MPLTYIHPRIKKYSQRINKFLDILVYYALFRDYVFNLKQLVARIE